jgi:hypothetical protein
MNYTLKHNLNPYYTHQPVLYEMLLKTKGPILELGCGEGSTELIDIISKKQNRKVVTVESDSEWMSKYKLKYENKNHNFILTSDHSVVSWNNTTDTFVDTKWGLIFIDQGFWEARSYSFNKLKNSADYLILHDCDYFPENNLLGTCIEKYINSNNRGKRDYSKDVKYWKEYFPIIFAGHTGPPTLLASEKYDCDISVDFERYYVII